MQNETVSTTTCTYIPKRSKADAKGYKFKRSKWFALNHFL